MQKYNFVKYTKQRMASGDEEQRICLFIHLPYLIICPRARPRSINANTLSRWASFIFHQRVTLTRYHQSAYQTKP